MTREEYAGDRKVASGGRITSPGKFEGELYYVPWFWDRLLEGFADEDDVDNDGACVAYFLIDSSDVERFPELANVVKLHLSEDGQGFVRCFHSYRGEE